MSIFTVSTWIASIQETMSKFTGSTEQVYIKQWSSLQATMHKSQGAMNKLQKTVTMHRDGAFS